jgi:hypothetical protein
VYRYNRISTPVLFVVCVTGNSADFNLFCSMYRYGPGLTPVLSNICGAGTYEYFSRKID